MRPKRKKKTAKGLIEEFYTTEAKGKVLNPNGGEREPKVT